MGSRQGKGKENQAKMTFKILCLCYACLIVSEGRRATIETVEEYLYRCFFYPIYLSGQLEPYAKYVGLSPRRRIERPCTTMSFPGTVGRPQVGFKTGPETDLSFSVAGRCIPGQEGSGQGKAAAGDLSAFLDFPLIILKAAY